jgi:hypothetical protein
MPDRLHPEDLERLAELVADRLADRLGQGSGVPALADVKALAAALGVSADFIREHAAELGGFRIADTPRAPWRFDVGEARRRMAARAGAERSDGLESTGRVGRSPRPRARPTASTGRILAIRGSEG